MSFITNWTPEEDGILREMWLNGASAAKIGKCLNRSKNSVIGRSHRMSLKGRPSPIRPAIQASERPAASISGPTLPPLQSLSATGAAHMPSELIPRFRSSSAWNALPPQPADTQALVVKLLTEGNSNVLTAEMAHVSLHEVRKIRKTIEVPKRKHVVSEVRRRPIDEPRQYSVADLEFRNRSTLHRSNPWKPPRFEARFQFGKQLEKSKPRGDFPTAAEIAAFIAQHGVTQCPAAAVAATTVSIAEQDRIAIAAHQQVNTDAQMARFAEYSSRGGRAAKRAAAMRR